jgi:hypothetical protein
VGAIHHVPVVDGHFVFPDVRLDIETAEGAILEGDLELVTEHLPSRTPGGKTSAGFRVYGSNSRAGGTPQHACETSEGGATPRVASVLDQRPQALARPAGSLPLRMGGRRDRRTATRSTDGDTRQSRAVPERAQGNPDAVD